MRTLLAAASIALAACDGGGAPADGGADGAAEDGGEPTVPWLADGVPPIAPPVLTPCPDGWREVADGDLVTCDPYPEGGPMTCGVGDAHFPGEPGCAPVGDPCPVGDFAEGLPTDGTVVYVKSGEVGGDGSLATPFGSLGEVRWGSLASGTTVALAKGAYDGTVSLRAGVTIAGACAAETILTGIDAPVSAVIQVTSAGDPATVRNLTVSGAPQPAIHLEERALRVDGVVIDGCTGWNAIGVGGGAELVARSLVVRGQLARAPTEGSIALSAEASATIEVSRAVLESNAGVSVASRLGAHVSLADVAILSTAPIPDGSFGWGATVQEGGILDASRVLVAGSHQAAILAGDAGSTITLTDSIVRDTEGTADGTMGRGINVQLGASFTGRRLLLERNREVAIFVGGPDVAFTLEDAVIRDTMFESATGAYGRGLSIQEAAASASRIVLTRNHDVGLFANGNTSVTLADVVISDVVPNPATLGEDSGGLVMQHGGRMDAERLHIARIPYVGIVSFDQSVLSLSDVAVTGTGRADCSEDTCADNPGGYSIGAVGASVQMERFASVGSAVCGAFVAEDGGLDLATGVVREAAIGACVQVDGYDLGRLTRNVRFADNETNLATTTLPVPRPFDPPAGP
jgi:hypothetical protein